MRRGDAMTDDERRAVIARGYATLARDVEPHFHRDEPEELDAVEQWRRRHTKPEAPAQRQMTDAMALRTAMQWQSHLDARMAEERAVSQQVHTEVVIKLRQEYRAEIGKLSRNVDDLAKCFGELLKATEKLDGTLDDLFEKKFDSATVIELPRLPLRGDRRA
jgi:hypothetical protein